MSKDQGPQMLSSCAGSTCVMADNRGAAGYWLFMLLFIIFLISCSDPASGGGSVAADGRDRTAPRADSVAYAQGQRLFRDNCVKCHVLPNMKTDASLFYHIDFLGIIFFDLSPIAGS